MTIPAGLVAAITPMPAIGPSWLDPQALLEGFGSWALLGIVAVIVAETGLLVGFFLPGDSLLFTAGLLTSQGVIHQPIWVVVPVTAVAAFAGDQLGYLIGRRAGPRLFDRPDSRLFKRSFVDKTHEFFDQHGARAIVLGRFIPIVRTFMPVTAGISRMPYRKFVGIDAIGALIWGAGVTTLGYFLGQISFIRNNIEVLLIVMVLVSITPPGIELLRHRAKSRRAAATPPATTSGTTAATGPGSTDGPVRTDDAPLEVSDPAPSDAR